MPREEALINASVEMERSVTNASVLKPLERSMPGTGEITQEETELQTILLRNISASILRIF